MRRLENQLNQSTADFAQQLRESSTQIARTSAERDSAIKELDIARAQTAKLWSEKIEAEKNVAASREKISSLVERIEQRAEEEKKLREKMTSDFELLSSRLLETSRQKMSTSNLEQLGLLLNPLKSNINDFREHIDKLNLESQKNRAGMETQISNLLQMSMQLSQDATNLTQALRGNNKIAGNWGETILQRIFESCGFKEGIHYRSQNSYRDTVGEQVRLIPDFIIDLPDSRSIVVDSKLSLVDYVDYCASETQAQKRVAIEKFKKSVRAHLKEFADKYNNLPDVKSGFKMMFMPIEPAYELIMSEDKKIVFDAFDSNVLIVGPTSVMAVLKFAEITLRNDALAKNTQEIATIGNQLYKKVNLFLERFQKLGERISMLTREYEASTVTLTQGSKSVLGISKRLGAKSSGDILEIEEEEGKENE